uniref:Ribonuclease H-like domain-containing protein n=1 Tax=Tanacetum cinerariifolium TaxID=118510 RepID=A0A699HG55_TANCI|nr:ribonuclease H-like domain-containing protein [Tanacetum cinerariifolium]
MSRHMRFNEDVFPFRTVTSTTTPTHDFLLPPLLPNVQPNNNIRTPQPTVQQEHPLANPLPIPHPLYPAHLHKFHADGSLSKYKAHLIANGRSQNQTSSSAFLRRVIVSLHGEFAMTNLGSLNYFLGISAQRSSVGFYLSQSTYALEILKRAHMQKCNPCRTPIDTRSKLGVDVQQVCFYMHDPREPHLAALKRILRHLRGTIDHCLRLHVLSTSQLTGYTNVDWAGFSVTRRSTSGYYVFLGDNLLSWSAKQHVTLSRSSAEVEYRGVANVVVGTVWVRNLLHDLHAPLFIATFVYCDNVSVVYLSTNPVQHQRTKHIEIHIHFVRDFVASGQVRVFYVPCGFSMLIYLFTKGLPSALFLEFRFSLNVRRPPGQSVRMY